MKTWIVKTIVGSDHKVSFIVPDDIPEGPLEMVVVTQGTDSIEALEWTKEQAAESRTKVTSPNEDWIAHGIEVYDSL